MLPFLTRLIIVTPAFARLSHAYASNSYDKDIEEHEVFVVGFRGNDFMPSV